MSIFLKRIRQIHIQLDLVFSFHVYVWIGSVYAHQIPETNKQQKIRRRATEFTFQSIRQSMGKLDTCFKSSKLIWVFLPREPQNILSTKMFVKIFVPNAHRRFDFKPLYSSPLLFFLLLLSSSYFLHYVFVSYFFCSLSLLHMILFVYNVRVSVCAVSRVYLTNSTMIVGAVDFVRLIIICSFQRRLHGDSFVMRIVLLW